MSEAIHPKHRRRTRRIVSTFAATLMAGAIAAAAPAGAAAGPDKLTAPGGMSIAAWACSAGDFCLYEHLNGAGGRYFHSGNDGNLHNDYFRAGVPVANNASSARNAGTPASYDDVVVYDGTWFSGALNCIPRDYVANFGSAGSDNRVESFAWTTSC